MTFTGSDLHRCLAEYARTEDPSFRPFWFTDFGPVEIDGRVAKVAKPERYVLRNGKRRQVMVSQVTGRIMGVL